MKINELTINQLLQSGFSNNPAAVAIKDGDRVIRYDELNTLVNGFAQRLLINGVGKGDAIVIFADRAIEVVAVILAVLKLGAYYVPVSNDTPLARLEFICQDVNAALLLVDTVGEKVCADLNLANLNDIAFVRLPLAVDLPTSTVIAYPPVHSDDIAYVIYTSGTTGKPKGVIIEHGSIARKFYDWDERYGLNATVQSLLQVSQLGFDVFTGDWVKMLCSGGRLVLCGHEKLVDPGVLYPLLIDEQIDYIDVVPAIVRILTDYVEQIDGSLASLAVLNCGSDVWTKEEYVRFKAILKVPRLINGYGVTECSVENATFEDDNDRLSTKGTLPIGQPLHSDRFMIIDQARHPVAQNVRGEICIGGPCVARGYVNRPQLNAEKFFVLNDESGQQIRFYRTGDVGSIDADGHVDFYGRADYQVKVNGYRIELHEIESVLEKHPEVNKAVAFVDDKQSWINAAVQTHQPSDLTSAKLIDQVSDQLPKYMMPAHIELLAQLPMTSNGKIDRKTIVAQFQPSRTSHGGGTGSMAVPVCADLAALTEFLQRHEIDLTSVIVEFIKFRKIVGIAVVGPLTQGLKAADERIELLVFADDIGVLKRPKDQLFGHPVEYIQCQNSQARRATTMVNNINISVEFVFRSDMAGTCGQPQPDWKNSNQSHYNPADTVATQWIVEGKQMIDTWYSSSSQASSQQSRRKKSQC